MFKVDLTTGLIIAAGGGGGAVDGLLADAGGLPGRIHQAFEDRGVSPAAQGHADQPHQAARLYLADGVHDGLFRPERRHAVHRDRRRPSACRAAAVRDRRPQSPGPGHAARRAADELSAPAVAPSLDADGAHRRHGHDRDGRARHLFARRLHRPRGDRRLSLVEVEKPDPRPGRAAGAGARPRQRRARGVESAHGDDRDGKDRGQFVQAPAALLARLCLGPRSTGR